MEQLYGQLRHARGEPALIVVIPCGQRGLQRLDREKRCVLDQQAAYLFIGAPASGGPKNAVALSRSATAMPT
jgi:hypothetical protein